MQAKQILLITSNEDLYFELVEQINSLNNIKSKVSWARDYATGEQLATKGAEIAIIDEDITDGDTISFLKYITENNLSLPVIALSDGKSKDRDIELLRAGAADYLIKGKIKPIYLYRAIRYSLERSSVRKTESELQQELMEDRKLSALGEFASNIALELGQNLEILNDYLENIISECALSPASKSSFDHCKKYLKRSRGVIKNLLAYSSPRGKIVPQCDLKSLLLDSADFLNKATRQDIRVLAVSDVDEDLLAEVDPSQIKQALANMVLNAQEAMLNGGKVAIKIFLPERKDLPAKLQESDQAYAAITVKDTGTGIPKENISRIFEPNFTTKSNKRGLGLGLAKVFSIVKAHNGWISVNSELNKGSCFTVYLPLIESESKSQKEGHRGLVMVIEPDAAQNQVCKLYFEAASLESRIFNTYEAALDWYRKNFRKVNLLMIDLRSTDSPVLALDEIRKIAPKTKIILTGDCLPKEIKITAESEEIKFFPEQNKYLAAISWVSEALG